MSEEKNPLNDPTVQHIISINRRLDRLDSSMESFGSVLSDIREVVQESRKDIDAKLNVIEKRINDVENSRSILVGFWFGVCGIVGVLWSIFDDKIKHFFP